MEPARVMELLAEILAKLQEAAMIVGNFLDLITGWIGMLEQFLPQDILFITDFVQSLLQFLKDVIV